MKNRTLVTLFFLFSILAKAQEYNANKIVFTDSTNIELLKKNEIYSLNKEELYRLISKSKKKYNLLVSFAIWCGPCQESLPLLLKLAEKNKEKLSLYIINIENDKSKRLTQTKKFFNEIKYSNPTFMVSETYGRNSRLKYKNFIKDIIGKKEFNSSYLGLFENILFDKNFKILFKSTYNDNDEVILYNINKIINE